MFSIQMKRNSAATYGKPASGRLLRQVPLGDLRLEELVEALSGGLAPARPKREAEAHEPDAEEDGDEPTEPEVGHGLVDREVERPELDLDPRRKLELVRRVEVSRRRGEDEAEDAHSRALPAK
jgi:hypothetical protein